MSFDPYSEPAQANGSPSNDEQHGLPWSESSAGAAAAPSPVYGAPHPSAPQPTYLPPSPQPEYTAPYAPPPPAQGYIAPPPPAQGYIAPPPPAQGYIAPHYGAPGVGYSPLAPAGVIYDNPNSPGAPLHGASPLEAMKRFWQKGVTFTGRASRSEFWWMFFWQMIISIGFATLSGSFLAAQNGTGLNLWTALLSTYMLASLIPALALGVRRLHDVNQSGWWLLISLVPFGGVVTLVFFLMPSDPRGARFDS